MITYYFCNYHLKTVLIIFTEQHKFKIQLSVCGLTASPFYCQAVFHDKDMPQFVYLPVKGHPRLCPVWGIMNKAAMNILVKVFA